MVDGGMQGKTSYDTTIIRPQMRIEDVKMRGRDVQPGTLKDIKKGLLTLHTLELMASTIYKFQITGADGELNRQLIAAMCNEMTHYQDFQVKLFEYGWRPSLWRWTYWIVGFVFGFGSRLLGSRAILKTGIWVEAKAVEHYAELLETIAWDEQTRRIVEKDQADEKGHIQRWRSMLGKETPRETWG